MPVSKRVRFEVLRRDNHACRYCHAADQPLTVDHVIPVALGGSDTPDNLVAACRDCNSGKTSTQPDAPLVADVAADAIRWSRAMRAAVEIQRAAREERDAYATAFNQEWLLWDFKLSNQPLPRPDDWRITVWQFFDLRLPIEDLLDAVEIAATKPGLSDRSLWRYMCGVAWRKLTAIQELARQQLEWTED